MLLIFFIGFFSCSDTVSPERELYECWNKSFAENQIDMESELLKFENDLIKNGYLSDNSWKSYQNLIDSLSQDTFPMIGRTISMEEFSKATFQVVKKCSDTTLYNQIPKLATLMDTLLKFYLFWLAQRHITTK